VEGKRNWGRYGQPLGRLLAHLRMGKKNALLRGLGRRPTLAMKPASVVFLINTIRSRYVKRFLRIFLGSV